MPGPNGECNDQLTNEYYYSVRYDFENFQFSIRFLKMLYQSKFDQLRKTSYKLVYILVQLAQSLLFM